MVDDLPGGHAGNLVLMRAIDSDPSPRWPTTSLALFTFFILIATVAVDSVRQPSPGISLAIVLKLRSADSTGAASRRVGAAGGVDAQAVVAANSTETTTHFVSFPGRQTSHN